MIDPDLARAKLLARMPAVPSPVMKKVNLQARTKNRSTSHDSSTVNKNSNSISISQNVNSTSLLSSVNRTSKNSSSPTLNASSSKFSRLREAFKDPEKLSTHPTEKTKCELKSKSQERGLYKGVQTSVKKANPFAPPPDPFAPPPDPYAAVDKKADTEKENGEVESKEDSSIILSNGNKLNENDESHLKTNLKNPDSKNISLKTQQTKFAFKDEQDVNKILKDTTYNNTKNNTFSQMNSLIDTVNSNNNLESKNECQTPAKKSSSSRHSKSEVKDSKTLSRRHSIASNSVVKKTKKRKDRMERSQTQDLDKEDIIIEIDDTPPPRKQYDDKLIIKKALALAREERNEKILKDSVEEHLSRVNSEETSENRSKGKSTEKLEVKLLQEKLNELPEKVEEKPLEKTKEKSVERLDSNLPEKSETKPTDKPEDKPPDKTSEPVFKRKVSSIRVRKKSRRETGKDDTTSKTETKTSKDVASESKQEKSTIETIKKDPSPTKTNNNLKPTEPTAKESLKSEENSAPTDPDKPKPPVRKLTRIIKKEIRKVTKDGKIVDRRITSEKVPVTKKSIKKVSKEPKSLTSTEEPTKLLTTDDESHHRNMSSTSSAKIVRKTSKTMKLSSIDSHQQCEISECQPSSKSKASRQSSHKSMDKEINMTNAVTTTTTNNTHSHRKSNKVSPTSTNLESKSKNLDNPDHRNTSHEMSDINPDNDPVSERDENSQEVSYATETVTIMEDLPASLAAEVSTAPGLTDSGTAEPTHESVSNDRKPSQDNVLENKTENLALDDEGNPITKKRKDTKKKKKTKLIKVSRTKSTDEILDENSKSKKAIAHVKKLVTPTNSAPNVIKIKATNIRLPTAGSFIRIPGKPGLINPSIHPRPRFPMAMRPRMPGNFPNIFDPNFMPPMPGMMPPVDPNGNPMQVPQVWLEERKTSSNIF